MAISDVVLSKELPDDLKKDILLYSSCVSGASSIEDIDTMLTTAGFSNIKIEPKFKSREFIQEWAPGIGIENYIVSATIEAVKEK